MSDEGLMNDVTCSIYCPTWSYSYVGWRSFFAGIHLFIPRIEFSTRVVYPFRKYLKREQERVFLVSDGHIICSPENYTFLLKERRLK